MTPLPIVPALLLWAAGGRPEATVGPCEAAMCRCVAPPDSGPALAERVAAWRARPGGVVLARVVRLDTLDVTRTATYAAFDRSSSGLIVARLRVLRAWVPDGAPGAADTDLLPVS